MDICNICHEPLRSNQLIKSYHGAYSWYGQMNRAHLDCYKKLVKLAWTFLPIFWIGFIAGIVLIAFGGIALGDADFMSHSTGVILLVIGIIVFIIAAIAGIMFLKKFFGIRKNPGEHLIDSSKLK